MTKGERRIVLERALRAAPDKVWRMWTTKEGLEAWWGPEGFSSVVPHLDVRVGGRFEIVMTAMLPAIVEHLERSGIPRSSTAKGDYVEIDPGRRLAYENGVDFVPGVPPYKTTTVVTLEAEASGGTRLVVTNDAMHDEQWTKMASMGWEQQLGKLEKALA